MSIQDENEEDGKAESGAKKSIDLDPRSSFLCEMVWE